MALEPGDVVQHKLRLFEKMVVLGRPAFNDSVIVRRYNAVKDRYDTYTFKEIELEKVNV